MDRSKRSAQAVVLAAGFSVLFISGGSRFALGLALKPMSDALGWDRETLGAAVFLFQVVSAVCMYAAGRLADRVSLRLVMGLGLCAGALGVGLMGLVTAPWQALILYGVVFAVGNGATSTAPVGVMVARAFAGRAGLANGVATSGLSAGQLVGVAALSAVLVAGGWRMMFVLIGLAMLACAPPILLAVPGRRPPAAAKARAETGQSLGEALCAGRLWLLLGVYAICGFNDFFVSTNIVAFAQDRGVGALVSGDLLAAMGLTGLLGVIAAGAWGDRIGPVACTAWSFVIRALIFAMIYVDQSTPAIVAFALIFGATFLVTAPMTVLFVRESFGMRNLGALTGAIVMVHQICGGLGAFLGAKIYDATGTYDLAFAIMAVSALVALGLSLALADRKAAVAA